MRDRPEISNSRLLTGTIETSGIPLFLMYDLFWQDARVDRLVAPFLVLMHQIVRASVPLMQAASLRARQLGPDDGLCKQLHEYLEVHIEEEAHHDTWLMEDLVSAGLSEARVLEKIPSTSVAAMSGAQYYWIYHYHPAALLGYIRLLEGNPPSPGHIDRLQRLSGLPASAFRTYRLHGELDPNHLQQFDEMLDALPLSPEHNRLVGTSAIFTAHMLANCLGELLAEEHSAARDSHRVRAAYPKTE